MAAGLPSVARLTRAHQHESRSHIPPGLLSHDVRGDHRGICALTLHMRCWRGSPAAQHESAVETRKREFFGGRPGFPGGGNDKPRFPRESARRADRRRGARACATMRAFPRIAQRKQRGAGSGRREPVSAARGARGWDGADAASQLLVRRALRAAHVDLDGECFPVSSVRVLRGSAQPAVVGGDTLGRLLLWRVRDGHAPCDGACAPCCSCTVPVASKMPVGDYCSFRKCAERPCWRLAARAATLTRRPQAGRGQRRVRRPLLQQLPPQAGRRASGGGGTVRATRPLPGQPRSPPVRRRLTCLSSARTRRRPAR